MPGKQQSAEREAVHAAYQTVQVGQKQPKARRTALVSFIIPIDNQYRLTADELCWRIEKCRKDREWRPVEYHTTLQAAVNSLSERLLRTSDVQRLADALAAVKDVSRTLTLALASRLKVEVCRDA